MLKNIIAAAALCSVIPAFAAGPNLIMDYSFESANVPAGQYADFTGTQLTGWTATTGSIEVRNDLVGTAQDGNNFVELDSTANSSMATTFDSVAGQTYTLSFYYSGRPASASNPGFPGGVVPSSSQGLAFSVGSFSDSLFAPTNTTSDNIWQQYTSTFVGTGGVMTLAFAATGTNDSFGASLDNVSVTTTAVPEPMPLAMMGVGLLGLMGLRKRFRGN
jgi:hypothetical protein